MHGTLAAVHLLGLVQLGAPAAAPVGAALSAHLVWQGTALPCRAGSAEWMHLQRDGASIAACRRRAGPCSDDVGTAIRMGTRLD